MGAGLKRAAPFFALSDEIYDVLGVLVMMRFLGDLFAVILIFAGFPVLFVLIGAAFGVYE